VLIASAPGRAGDLPLRDPPGRAPEAKEEPSSTQIAVPRWSDWNLTLWGGAMTNGNMGESLLFRNGFRSEALAGVGVQGTIWNRRRIGVILDANLLGHRNFEGGNSTAQQTFGEGTIGLGLRYYPNSWIWPSKWTRPSAGNCPWWRGCTTAPASTARSTASRPATTTATCSACATAWPARARCAGPRLLRSRPAPGNRPWSHTRSHRLRSHQLRIGRPLSGPTRSPGGQTARAPESLQG